MKKYKALIIVLSIVLFLGITIFSLYPKIKLSGGNITLSINEGYKEYGYDASNIFSNFKDKIEVSNNIDNKKIGTYYVDYNLKYLFLNIKKSRIVEVVDIKSPVIELEGESEVLVCPNKKYEEEGYTAIDDYDGDITDKVDVKNYEDKIVYNVSDTSLNNTSVVRNIKYEDNTAPEINLSGEESITIYAGSSFNEPGYEAIDNCDGDITDKVSISGSVDVYNVGSYSLTYKVVDEQGNEASVDRVVRVINRPSTYGNGKIYLTFDDGPSYSITSSVLDILSEEGIKATFFVLNKSDSLNYLILREYNEGHTVALHGATHEYSYIYTSADNFFSDLNIISTKVRNITGSEPKILRFPGGSSNTVSRHYCTGIMSYLTKEVTARGYHYFDWNVDSEDAGGASSSTAVYYNVINSLSHSKTNVVLMHDFENNYKTLNALRDIIRYGKDNGYTFEAITMDTPQVIHGVNN